MFKMVKIGIQFTSKSFCRVHGRRDGLRWWKGRQGGGARRALGVREAS